MNLLGIDTSTDVAFVALYANGQYYEVEKADARSHAHALLTMIEGVLLDAQITLNHLDGLVFGQGPGSFTGLRVACSMVKGLSYGLNLPVYPVCTLSAMIWAIRREHACSPDAGVLVMMDARMNQLYWLFDFADEVTSVQVSNPECIEIAAQVPLVLAGTGWSNYESRLNPALKTRIIFKREIYPKASLMIEMVLHGMIGAVNANEALPLYVRNQVVQGG